MIALDEADKGQLYTDRFLRDACTNFILAGRDTSSVALSWLFWLLTWHPEVEEKIVAEVEAVVKARGPGEASTGKANLLLPYPLGMGPSPG